MAPGREFGHGERQRRDVRRRTSSRSILKCLTTALPVIVLVFASAVRGQTTTGIVRWTDAPYPQGTTHVAIEVVDPDRDLQPGAPDQVLVHAESPSDTPEPLVLTETGAHTGIFRGSIPLDTVALGQGPGVQDGRVQGRIGDSLTARYIDPTDDFGNPKVLTQQVLLAGLEGRLPRVLSMASSPYVVTADVEVAGGDTLHIEPGVEIRFLPRRCMRVLDRGSFIAPGTPENEIHFVAHQSGPASHWGCLSFLEDNFDSLPVALHHVIFEGGGNGQAASLMAERPLSLYDCAVRSSSSAGVLSYNAALYLRNVDLIGNQEDGIQSDRSLDWRGGRVESNGGSGIHVGGAGSLPLATIDSVLVQGNGLDGISDHTESPLAHVVVRHCTVKNNGGHGVYKTSEPSGALSVTECQLQDNNSGYDLYNDSTNDVLAQYNDWGPATTSEMNTGPNPRNIARIFDVNDDPSTAALEATGRSLGALMTAAAAVGFSGVVLVAQDDRILLRQAYGLADRSTRTPVTVEMPFDIGSITKQFTAAAILRLEMQGKLDVQQPISTYLDSVPADKAGITLHHVLTHTAGFPEYSGDDYAAATRDPTVKNILATPIESKPGSAFEYSNPTRADIGNNLRRLSPGHRAAGPGDFFAGGSRSRRHTADLLRRPCRHRPPSPVGWSGVRAALSHSGVSQRVNLAASLIARPRPLLMKRKSARSQGECRGASDSGATPMSWTVLASR